MLIEVFETTVCSDTRPYTRRDKRPRKIFDINKADIFSYGHGILLVSHQNGKQYQYRLKEPTKVIQQLKDLGWRQRVYSGQRDFIPWEMKNSKEA